MIGILILMNLMYQNQVATKNGRGWKKAVKDDDDDFKVDDEFKDMFSGGRMAATVTTMMTMITNEPPNDYTWKEHYLTFPVDKYI